MLATMRIYVRAKNQAAVSDWCSLMHVNPAAVVFLPLDAFPPPLGPHDCVVDAEVSTLAKFQAQAQAA